MRHFDSGATRGTEDGKLDYEGFLSPIVLERFAEYMHKHRQQADGELRDSDNWQHGMPPDVYLKSAFRHFMAVWKIHRGIELGSSLDLEDSLCGLLFNVMGYLHQVKLGRVGEAVELANAAEAEFFVSGSASVAEPFEPDPDGRGPIPPEER